MDAAVAHCTKGLGIWDWASTDEGDEPDVVLVGCGDIPTQEALAGSVLLREAFPKLKIRFINVIDLFKLQPEQAGDPCLEVAVLTINIGAENWARISTGLTKHRLTV